MVLVGETNVEVPETVPTPLSIVSVGVGVPVTDQLRVVDCPEVMVVGVALNVEIVGIILGIVIVKLIVGESEPVILI